MTATARDVLAGRAGAAELSQVRARAKWGGAMRSEIVAGRHRFVADEPPEREGHDDGPTPLQLALSALCACEIVTMKRVADRLRMRVEDFEIDADGVIDVRRAGDAWVEIAIWNPDGSLAEMSGNGTRIAARWLAERTGAERVAVRVGAREVVTRMLAAGLVEQELGPVRVGATEEAAGVRFTPVDVGNPHAVVQGDPADLPRVGPLLETHPRFPQRTNVQVARRVREGEIEARVWERGVGETRSSGTSAVAVAAALGVSPATVRFPGGDLHVRLEDDCAYLTGPAERVD
jgi:diaminopimelate epimerase